MLLMSRSVARGANVKMGMRHLSSQRAKAPAIALHPFTVEGEPLDANQPSPAGDLFAVIAHSGTQYKVTPDDTIVVDKMSGVDIGDQIVLDEVLLVGSKKTTLVGRPLVTGSKVLASVEEIAKDKKLITFKTRRRKASKSTRGFRREITVLRIEDIVVTDDDHKAII